MKKSETIQVVALLAGNYESIANKTDKQKQLMINTWQECLGDLEYNLVLQAVKKTIIQSQYPPTIHEIRKNAIEIIKPNTRKIPIEAWNEAYSMICNGIYMSNEEFEKASPLVKNFFGSIKQVKELALTDSKTINTVTKGQFLKQFDILDERQKQQNLLPNNFNDLVNKLAKNMDIKQLKGAE